MVEPAPPRKPRRAGRASVKRWVVYDEPDMIDPDGPLFGLLRHYAELGLADRESWRDRVMELDGAGAKELSRLHGELIALGWVEQNTGATPVLKPGVAAACYRVTTHGLRAYRQTTGGTASARGRE
jgi:hypothetical protein